MHAFYNIPFPVGLDLSSSVLICLTGCSAGLVSSSSLSDDDEYVLIFFKIPRIKTVTWNAEKMNKRRFL